MAVRSKREFSDVLREAAKRAGFIDGASLAARTGINASTVRTWFSGESEPRFLQLAALAEIIERVDILS
jgi:transcriptional regulator with XRE-family HTH domain